MQSKQTCFSHQISQRLVCGIEQKCMTFDHDFGYSFPLFSSLLKKEGRRKGEWIAKIVIKSNAFLLDQCVVKQIKFSLIKGRLYPEHSSDSSVFAFSIYIFWWWNSSGVQNFEKNITSRDRKSNIWGLPRKNKKRREWYILFLTVFGSWNLYEPGGGFCSLFAAYLQPLCILFAASL